MKEAEFQAAHLFKTLGNPLRIRIVKILGKGPATPTQLAEELGKRRVNISQHLKVLRDCDVAWFTMQAKNVVYRIKDPSVLGIVEAAEKFAAARNIGPRSS